MKPIDYKNMPLNEKLELAFKSSDSFVLESLAKDSSSHVRRLVAKSKNVSKKTLNSLASDPVLNVSFIASNNPLCDKKRDFKEVDHPCVTCTKDERFIECLNCSLLNEFYNSK